MDAKAVRKSLSGNLSVPSLPSIVSETLALLESDNAGTREIGAMVATDPPLTVKLLRIANSALYGSKAPILSPEHAAAVLGFDALRNMLVRASVVDLFAHLDKFPGLDLSIVWKESRVCSRVARQFPGTWAETVKPEDAYLCGLLHNIGVFVLLDQFGKDYIQILQEHWKTNKPLRTLELASFQLSHDQIGFLVARRWALPVSLIESIRYHLDSAGRVQKMPLVAVTHCARVLSQNLLAGSPKRASSLIQPKVLELLGVAPRELDLYSEECKGSLAELES